MQSVAAAVKPAAAAAAATNANDGFDDGMEIEGEFLFRPDLPKPKPVSGKKREYPSSFTVQGKLSVFVEKNNVWNPVAQ